MNSSTLEESVGIVGTYWKDGKRKAEAGGVVEGDWALALLVMGIERFVFDGCRGDSNCEGGESVGENDELVSMTL